MARSIAVQTADFALTKPWEVLKTVLGQARLGKTSRKTGIARSAVQKRAILQAFEASGRRKCLGEEVV